MPPKQQRGEATVDRLLAAALDVYAQAGREGFTVNAVIAASGVSPGSLYHHFGNFDGLAAGLYNRCITQLFDELITALKRARTARTGVHAIVVTYLRFTEQQPAAARFIHESVYARYLAAHAEEVISARSAKLETIAEWFRPRIAAGELAAIPESLIEVLVLGPVAETARRRLSGAPGIELAQAVRVLPDRIWRSVQA